MITRSIVLLFLVSQSVLNLMAEPSVPNAVVIPEGYLPEARQPDEKILYREIGDARLHLHMFYPEGHAPGQKRPVMLFFHGGGFNGNARQFYAQADYFSHRGAVAIAVEYRQPAKYDNHPIECIRDGAAAVRYVREQAEDLGIDPAKVIVGGGSSGGLIAAVLAASTDFAEEPGANTAISSRPDLCISYNGGTRLTPMTEEDHRHLEARYPEYSAAEQAAGKIDWSEYADRICPSAVADERHPPTILLFGSEDQGRYPARLLDDKLAELRVPCRFFTFDRVGHGFFNHRIWLPYALAKDEITRKRYETMENPRETFWNPYFVETCRLVDAILVEYGYLEGSPDIDLSRVADDLVRIHPKVQMR